MLLNPGPRRRLRQEDYHESEAGLHKASQCQGYSMEPNSRAWLHMPSIPALSTQRQAELWEFEATLVYIVSLGYPGLHNEAIPKQNSNKTVPTKLLSL